MRTILFAFLSLCLGIGCQVQDPSNVEKEEVPSPATPSVAEPHYHGAASDNELYQRVRELEEQARTATAFIAETCIEKGPPTLRQSELPTPVPKQFEDMLPSDEDAEALIREVLDNKGRVDLWGFWDHGLYEVRVKVFTQVVQKAIPGAESYLVAFTTDEQWDVYEQWREAVLDVGRNALRDPTRLNLFYQEKVAPKLYLVLTQLSAEQLRALVIPLRAYGDFLSAPIPTELLVASLEESRIDALADAHGGPCGKAIARDQLEPARAAVERAARGTVFEGGGVLLSASRGDAMASSA